MTNIPYEESEKRVWLASASTNTSHRLRTDRFRSALRIDVFLKNEPNPMANKILINNGFEASNNGLREYLEMWIKIMSPEYIIVII